MGRPKGLPKTGGRQKGTPNKVTLLKEERRAIFDEEVSQMYKETIKKARPEYLLDQFLGKAPDKIEHSGEIRTTSIPKEALEIIERDLKEKKVKENNHESGKQP